MSQFVQVHLLTAYPPACLNRDDLNRPKTARMGGVQRLRVSSQCLKRTWRTSDLFQEAMAGHVGTRTKEMGIAIFQSLTKGIALADAMAGHLDARRERTPVAESRALPWTRDIAAQFGSVEEENSETPSKGLCLKQIAHFKPEEVQAIDRLLASLAKDGRKEGPTKDELALLQAQSRGVDIAMFGRMLADTPSHNVEAAVQVAHAVTIHEVAVEDDFFTAVDDLNRGDEDRGSAHMGENEFGAGVFYGYLCINKDLLVANLQGDATLAAQAIRSLVEAAAKVAPSGKQNSFGSRAYASFILAEKGDQQPRSLAVAFLKPVSGPDFVADGIAAIRATRDLMDKAYGACAEEKAEMIVPDGTGTLDEVLDFVAGA